MKYSDGQDVRLGDHVKVGEGEGGFVVASIDTGEYSGEHSEAQWGYLKKGVLIEFPQYGLIHYEQPEPDLQLIGRAKIRQSSWDAEAARAPSPGDQGPLVLP